MSFRQYDVALGGDKVSVVETTTATALLAGAGDLGGPGARLLLDGAVVRTSAEAARQLEVLRQYIIERPWPPGTDIWTLWILRTGEWDDGGYWIDNETWKDS